MSLEDKQDESLLYNELVFCCSINNHIFDVSGRMERRREYQRRRALGVTAAVKHGGINARLCKEYEGLVMEEVATDEHVDWSSVVTLLELLRCVL